MSVREADALTDSRGNPPPENLEVDAFCIGAAKSGSTWLAWVLDQHPEIQVSDPKETNFFTERGSPYMNRPPKGFLCDWRWYEQCFPAEGRVNIDFSIHTVADPEAPKRIQAVYPSARFLLILRDPVKRLYSHYRHEERIKVKGVKYAKALEPTFEQALENAEFVRRSRYSELLAPWLKVFPKERFHMVTMESARAEPVQHVQEICRTLGVDDSFRPQAVERQVHPHRVDRGLERTINGAGTWARRHGMGRLVTQAGRRFPWRVVNWFDKKKVQYPPLDPDLEVDLRRRFLPEIEKTEQMLDVDLRVWKPASST